MAKNTNLARGTVTAPLANDRIAPAEAATRAGRRGVARAARGAARRGTASKVVAVVAVLVALVALVAVASDERVAGYGRVVRDRVCTLVDGNHGR